jgi:hypothetical protein
MIEAKFAETASCRHLIAIAALTAGSDSGSLSRRLSSIGTDPELGNTGKLGVCPGDIGARGEIGTGRITGGEDSFAQTHPEGFET